MFNSIYEHIKDRVVLGYKTKKLEYDSQNKIWIIDDKYRTKNIINTAPWPVLDVHLNGFNFKKEFEKLKYLSDVISLWEREPYDHKAQWKYIPNPDIEQHREFYIHNYAPYSKPGGVMTDINSIRWRQHNKKWKAGVPLYEHENVYSYPMPTTPLYTNVIYPTSSSSEIISVLFAMYIGSRYATIYVINLLKF